MTYRPPHAVAGREGRIRSGGQPLVIIMYTRTVIRKRIGRRVARPWTGNGGYARIARFASYKRGAIEDCTSMGRENSILIRMTTTGEAESLTGSRASGRSASAGGACCSSPWSAPPCSFSPPELEWSFSRGA